MSKCGKGCMPECEYFTTGGCISPFNCIYKEESGYINSATSGTVIYTGGMNMPDEKMTIKVIDDIVVGLNNIAAKYGYGKGTEPFTNEEWNTIFRAKEIINDYARLTAENAELKARLDKAVELQFSNGDEVYAIMDTLLYTGVIPVTIKSADVVYEVFDGEQTTTQHRTRIFTTRAEAEARLKELKGDKQ